MAARMLGRAVYGAFSRSVIPTGARLSSTSSRSSTSQKKLLALTGGAAIGVFCVYGYSKFRSSELRADGQHQVKGSELQVTESQWERITPPNYTVSRKVNGATDLGGVRLTLFQYQTCPFCCKVRAFLDFAGISYDVVEVDPVLRQQIKFSNYRKVPILLVQENDNCWQLNDSTVIISVLQSFLLDPKPGIQNYLQLYPPMKTHDASGKSVIEVFNKYNIMYGSQKADIAKIQDELRWRKWADDVLVHVLSPNVYQTPSEALQAFNYFSEVGDWERLFPLWERCLVIYVGAAAMYLVGKKLKKKHNLKDDVRVSFYEECDKWVNNLGRREFAGGPEPNLADLAVFGVLNSIEGCTAFQDVLQNTNIEPWYQSMKKVTGRST